MKERIMDYLEKLSTDNDSGLLEEIGQKTGYPPDLIQERAGKVLDNILHNYSQLSISTIDAFFQKIIKAFAKELGLMGNFSVELDEDMVLDEVVDLLIADVGKDAELTQWLIDFSSDSVEGGEAWDIRRKVKKFASELLREANNYSGQKDNGQNGLEHRRFLDELKRIKNVFIRDIRRLADEALNLIKKNGLSVNDFSNKQGGPAGYFIKVSQKKEFIPGTRFKEAVQDESKWYSKSSPMKEAIIGILQSGLMQKAKELWMYYRDNHRDYFTSVQIIGNYYLYGILSKLSEKLQVYRLEHDLMLISDVPVFLQKIIAGNDAPFIYEKTGSWYRHYLIDEFQDTSRFQWNNFRPLVENGLSQGNKSLLVGDGKQSIYRWRGGDWHLILHNVEQDLKHYNIVYKNLQTNWRSELNIIAFNNSLFSIAPSLLTANLKSSIDLPDETAYGELQNSLEDICNLYQEVSQEIPPKKSGMGSGDVFIRVFEKNPDKKWNDSVLDQLPQDIERIQDMGYSAGDIAILVRRAEEGRMVIEQLLKYKNSIHARDGYIYDAVSGESLFLGKSPVVRLLVNCLRFCANPSDILVLAEIKYCNFLIKAGSINSETIDMDVILSEDDLPTDFRQICTEIFTRPVFDMVESFLKLFELYQKSNQAYIEAFQDEVLKFFADRNKNLDDFLIWWDETGQSKSIAVMDTGNSIRVLTIHKSKGLEFGAVIIPFCGWKLSPESKHGITIWCETDQKPYTEMGKLPLKYAKALENTYFARNYYEEMILGNIDNLNLLYVATTRAESYLQINCPPESEKLTTSGDLVTRSIKELYVSSETPLALEFFVDEFSNSCYELVGNERTKKEIKLSVGDHKANGYVSSDWRQKVRIRPREEEVNANNIPEWKSRISYGLLIHDILAIASSEEEAQNQLEFLHISQKLSDNDYIKASRQIKQLFYNPQVMDWFHPRWTVRREAEIISGKDHLKRPDRVIFIGKKAVVIDFKTGQVRDRDKRQVVLYVNLMKEMGFDSVEGYLLYIENAEIEKVV